MKLPKLDNNSLALIGTGFVTFAFFFCGLLDILNLFIVKALLILAFCGVVAIAFYYAHKNYDKKKSP